MLAADEALMDSRALKAQRKRLLGQSGDDEARVFYTFTPKKILAVASKASSLLFQGRFSRLLHLVPVTLATRLPRGSLCGEQGPAGNVGRTRASPRVRLHFVSGPNAPALSRRGHHFKIRSFPLILGFSVHPRP